MPLLDTDRTLLAGLLASLEGYLRVDPMDPTGRAHALRRLARRASEDLGRGLAEPTPDDLVAAVAAVRERLRD